MSAQTEGRARTMSLRAVRRLSETEFSGLKIALTAIIEVEHTLVAGLAEMKKAAQREANIRRDRGLPLPGPYHRAYLATRHCIDALGEAREETTVAVDTAKVRKPRETTK